MLPEAERAVWSFVTGLLLNPEALREGLDEMVKQERAGNQGNLGEEIAVWLDRLASVERKRSNFQDMAAEGLITFDELGAKLAALEETHQTSYSKLIPDVLDALEPEERHRVYKMLRLRVLVYLDGTLEVSGALSDKPIVCNSKTIRSRSPSTSRRR